MFFFASYILSFQSCLFMQITLATRLSLKSHYIHIHVRLTFSTKITVKHGCVFLIPLIYATHVFLRKNNEFIHVQSDSGSLQVLYVSLYFSVFFCIYITLFLSDSFYLSITLCLSDSFCLSVIVSFSNSIAASPSRPVTFLSFSLFPNCLFISFISFFLLSLYFFYLFFFLSLYFFCLFLSFCSFLSVSVSFCLFVSFFLFFFCLSLSLFVYLVLSFFLFFFICLCLSLFICLFLYFCNFCLFLSVSLSICLFLYSMPEGLMFDNVSILPIFALFSGRSKKKYLPFFAPSPKKTLLQKIVIFSC